MDRTDNDRPRAAAPLRAPRGPRAWRRAAIDTLLARTAKAPAAWQWPVADGRLSLYRGWYGSSAAGRGTGGDTGRDPLGKTSRRAAIASREETSPPVTNRVHAAGAPRSQEPPLPWKAGAPLRVALLPSGAGTSQGPEPSARPRRRPTTSAAPAASRRPVAAVPPIARGGQGPAAAAAQAEAELRAGPGYEEATLPPHRPSRRYFGGRPEPEDDGIAPIAALPGAIGDGPISSSRHASLPASPHPAPAGHAAPLAAQQRRRPMGLHGAMPGIGAGQSRRQSAEPATTPLSPVSEPWPPETTRGRTGARAVSGALPAERPLGPIVSGAPLLARAGMPGRAVGDAGPTPASTRGPLGVRVDGLEGRLWGPERASGPAHGPILLRQEIVLRDEEGNTRRRLENDARWELYADGYR